MSTTPDSRQRAAWAGMIGPLLFGTVFTIEGWLRLGYDPRGMYVSELSLGPRGWIQIVNFVLFGLLLLVFARGMGAEFRNGTASRAGPILLTIVALGYLLSGPFVMDPADTPRAEMSWHGILHGIFGAVVFSLMPVSCFVFWRRFREVPNWRSLQWWTLTVGIVVAAASILQSVATKTLPTPNVFTPWVGLMQRSAIMPFLAWVFTVALHLSRQWRQRAATA